MAQVRPPANTGWKYDPTNERLDANYDGTTVLDFDANDLVVTPATTFSGAVTVTGAISVTGAVTASTLFNLAAADATVASGVLTAVTPVVNVLPESSTDNA
jgi:hypothetical protein